MAEQRKGERKLVKVKALVALEGGAPLAGRTWDLGANGVSILLDAPVNAGQKARVWIGLLIDGVSTPVQATATTQYCIFSNGSYKVGLQFVHVDLDTMSLLSRFLR